MLGQLPRDEEPDGCLDLLGSDGAPLLVVGELAGLGSNALEQIIDKRVHDAHGPGGDTGVRVHLLQNPVDVNGIGLLPFAPPLLLVTFGLGGLARLSSSLSDPFRRHCVGSKCT